MAGKKVFMYALSTCGWCRKTKALLKELNVDFDFIDVDLCEGEERRRVREELGNVNPRRSFPTLVIDGDVIVGFDPEKIRGALGIG
ncbi:MAG: glutaredoxin family protein [Planctomycetota bacterium]